MLLGAVLLTGLYGQAEGGAPSPVEVLVAGKPIRRTDIGREALPLVGAECLRRLIHDRLLTWCMERSGIRVRDAEIDDHIDFLLKMKGRELRRTLTLPGLLKITGKARYQVFAAQRDKDLLTLRRKALAEKIRKAGGTPPTYAKSLLGKEIDDRLAKAKAAMKTP